MFSDKAAVVLLNAAENVAKMASLFRIYGNKGKAQFSPWNLIIN